MGKQNRENLEDCLSQNLEFHFQIKENGKNRSRENPYIHVRDDHYHINVWSI